MVGDSPRPLDRVQSRSIRRTLVARFHKIMLTHRDSEVLLAMNHSVAPYLIVLMFLTCSSPDQQVTAAEPDSDVEAVTDVLVDTSMADIASTDTLMIDTSQDDSNASTDDATVEDAKDSEGLAADGCTHDAGEMDGSGQSDVVPCGQIVFSYQPTSSPKQVLLSGSFNGWASDSATAAVLSDDDGDGVWQVTQQLTPGSWQYKFIVDGNWIEDPNNPEKIDDGFGGYNSVLSIEPCPRALTLQSYTIQGSSLVATFTTPAWKVAPKEVSMTVDHKPSMALSWKDGLLKISIDNLADGIHDIRIHYDGVQGQDLWLLKVYVGVSTDWRDSTIYFVMTDRFVNGDQKNDDPVAGVDPATNFAGGDFKGITDKINSGYFTSLGVGALWLSWPVEQPKGAEEGLFPDSTGCNLGTQTTKYSPMKYTGYHGYWPVDTTQTEPRFGTLQELKNLVNAAHSKGIRVLLDYTANHVHSASPWFIEHSKKGWFHMPAEVCQDVGWDNKPVTCWFTSYLADLDYDNPQVIEASLSSAFWWAKQVGADGFRLDAVKHIEMAFVKALRVRANKEMELTGVDFYIVGETFTGDAQSIQAFVGEDKIHAQFDFPANMQLLKGFAKKQIGLDTMDAVIRGVRAIYDDQGAWMSTFIGNHDMARFISHASGSLDCGIWDIISNQTAGWKKPPKQPSSVPGL
ncbi:MAG TPA: hypothetical protein DCQ06_04295 [Myxococcales bacterium]|nr:hypothetical protein [Myxococcales bacterium]